MKSMALWFQPKVERTILKLLFRFFPDPCGLLEAGSNSGHLSIVLAKLGYKMTLVDRLAKPIALAREEFIRGKINAQFIVDDIRNLNGQWDGVWNTGVVQCYPPEDRLNLVNKLMELAPCVLFIYPDISHPNFPNEFDPNFPPGIAGCFEYSIPELPIIVAQRFKTVRYGTLTKDMLGLPYPMLYVSGNNPQ